jgi:hypothetical protein
MSQQQEAAREHQERQQKAQHHSQNLQAGISMQNGGRDAFLRELTRTDLSALDEASYELLQNLVSQDWLLGQYNESELLELKMDLLIIKEGFYAMHPSSDCVVTGEFREYVYDDPDESLEPLTQKARFQVETFFKAVWTRVTRGRNFKQQEMLVKSINESFVQDGREESGGGILGRFR